VGNFSLELKHLKHGDMSSPNNRFTV